MIDFTRIVLLIGVCLVASPLLAAPEATGEEDEIELERTLDLQASLIEVEELPTHDRTIARFRILDGEYRGAMFSFAYDKARPVRLRSWDVHDESGFKRIGGARVEELPLGQWDYLLLPRSHRPVRRIHLSLVQYDLNRDDEDRRWHFRQLLSIEPALWSDDESLTITPRTASSNP